MFYGLTLSYDIVCEIFIDFENLYYCTTLLSCIYKCIHPGKVLSNALSLDKVVLAYSGLQILNIKYYNWLPKSIRHILGLVFIGS